MGKGTAATIIFEIAIIVTFLIVFLYAFSSFAGGAPESQALNDFKSSVENVCKEGSVTATSVTLNLPKTDSKVFKLHMVGGQVEAYKCSNLGSAGCSDAEKTKTAILNCSSEIKFANCWIDAPHESVQITILKNISTKTVSLGQAAGVYC